MDSSHSKDLIPDCCGCTATERLHIDILTTILQQLADEAHVIHPKDYFKLLHSLAQVSKSWSYLVKSTPALWTRVSSWHPRSVVEIFLDRSKEAPLHIDATFWSNRADYSAFLTLVRQHLPRWHSITAICNRFGATLLRALRDSRILESEDATTLRHIKVGLREVGLRAVGLDALWPDLHLIGGNLAGVQTLHLYDVALRDWDTMGSASKLSILCLKYIGKAAPDIQQFLAALRACQDLEELQLIDCHPRVTDTSSESVAADSIVSLPRLHTISLTKVGYRAHSIILSALHIPRCTYFTLGVDEGGSWPPSLGAVLEPHFVTILNSPSSTLNRRVEIANSPERVGLFTYPDRKEFASFKLVSFPPRNTLPWIVNQYAKCARSEDELVALVLKGGTTLPLEAIVRSFQSLHHLDELRLSSFGKSRLDDILDNLGRRVDVDRTTRTLIADLTDLHINYPTPHLPYHFVLAMVQKGRTPAFGNLKNLTLHISGCIVPTERQIELQGILRAVQVGVRFDGVGIAY